MIKSRHILVYGAGSWGSALAIQLARVGHKIYLHSWRASHNQQMIQTHANEQYLPQAPFPENLQAVEDCQDIINECDYILLATPSSGFMDTLKLLAPKVTTQKLISATKGFCHNSYKLLHQLVDDALPKRKFALITGPSFAKEVAQTLPTAILTVAQDINYAKEIQELFNSSTFRCYTSNDMVGAQIGGAVKNALAIACGISDGLGFGANARAGLITRGLKELTGLGLTLGGKIETFNGLSGMGDLILTCTDNQSRNRRFGVLLGQGKSQKEAIEIIQQVVEGIATAKAIYFLAQKHHVEMPIVETVYHILHQGVDIKSAVNALLYRSLKDE